MKVAEISSPAGKDRAAIRSVERAQLASCNLYSLLLQAAENTAKSIPASTPEGESLRAAAARVRRLLEPEHQRMLEHLIATRAR